MTVASLSLSPRRAAIAPLFGATIFASAALVFMVEPMIAKMILPQLGGSPSVWNSCMAFFQTALLVGYLYAHYLQKLGSARLQIAVHLGLLAAAALALPLGVTAAFGAPPVGAPVWWLLRVLTVSIGAPFAILSATAPLLQAWYVRVPQHGPGAENPYILYGASNLGSMSALLVYPVLVEPLLALHWQAFDWALGYGAFCALMAGVGALVWSSAAPLSAASVATSPAPSWRTRLLWIALAAAPSSLMLGVTTYISDDVASVPFLWVIPLALYLLTFVISFQAKPIVSRERALLWQVVFVAMAAGLFCITTSSLPMHLFVYIGAFFFSALVCHQRLAASRPPVDHLTEFYLLLSLGGVVGGMFNAFLAPVIFSGVAEFPLMLALATLARPWNAARLTPQAAVFALIGIATAIAIVFVPNTPRLLLVPVFLAFAGAGAAASINKRTALFALVIGTFCVEAVLVPPDKNTILLAARSFFGVHRVAEGFDPALGGKLHLLFHGTTIHGAQPQIANQHCRATTYYAQQTPIGQTYTGVLSRHPQAQIGVVGLGAGTVATYARAGDHMRFFEIDPEVARIARDPRYFTYLSNCAKGSIDIVLGDARLTLAREKPGTLDLLQLDAFSADTVPTHLLTTEAFRLYLRLLKPNGILLLHLSNRNLALEAPAAAAAKEVDAFALMQEYSPPNGNSTIAAAPTQAMLVAKSKSALADFARDPRWRAARDKGVRAWSDDYTNVFGALLDRALAR